MKGLFFSLCIGILCAGCTVKEEYHNDGEPVVYEREYVAEPDTVEVEPGVVVEGGVAETGFGVEDIHESRRVKKVKKVKEVKKR